MARSRNPAEHHVLSAVTFPPMGPFFMFYQWNNCPVVLREGSAGLGPISDEAGVSKKDKSF